MAAKNIDVKFISQAKKYQQKLEEQNIFVKKMILFGSWAKGTQKPSSDIDICVVSPQFGKNRFEERVKLMRLSVGVWEEIEPHPYHPKDLKNKWDPLAAEIVKYGQEIPLI